MNQPNYQYPPYAFQPMPVSSADTWQVQTLAAANPALVDHLNQTLGLHLDLQSYDNLKHYFLLKESKTPTLGELRLLGHLMERTPLAFRLSPRELYTDSPLIMETWADIMGGRQPLCRQADLPCSLAEVLSMTEVYADRQNQRLPYDRGLRVVSPTDTASIMNQGYEPCLTLRSPSGPAKVLVKKCPQNTEPVARTPVEVNDLIMVLPPTELQAIQAFLREHPLTHAIKSKAIVQNGSILQAALEFCNGYGLSIQLDDLVPPVSSPENSRIQAYLDVWESVPAADTAYLVLCISPEAKNHLGAALAEHGFRPHVYGTVIKKPFLTMMDHNLVPVHLKKYVSFPPSAAVRDYSCTLPIPEPVAQKLHQPMYRTPLCYHAQEGCALADCTTVVNGAGSDGFTPSVQSVLSLCCDFAAAGICYADIRMTPVLYYDGAPESPLLLSAICGLYRAATELGIPLTNPKIMFKSSAQSPKDASLVLSLTAYSEKVPKAVAPTLTAPDLPLCLMSLDVEPCWNDIRGMLFGVAQGVTNDDTATAHSLQGRSILSQLDLLAAPEIPLSAGLFEEHKQLLSEAQPLGFLVEGAVPAGGLHIGITYHRAEEIIPPQQRECNCQKIEITPYPTVTLIQLKDKETQRRKEILAMEKIKAFEPLYKVPRTVLLDTDIGPDCDDVGALAVLIYYAKKYNFPIGGICNCTSNKAGNGVIDAVCRRCGIDTPPLGQWHGEGFMDAQEYCKYNTAVAEAHSEAYRNGTLAVDDEVTYYRKRLAAAKDGEVMVISIGMFNNLAALLDSPADNISPLTGMELVKAKVYALVSMAAILPQGRECNVMCDYKASEKVFASWPTPIYLSDFHIGVNVKTGYSHITDPEAIMADPLPMSYHLYTQAWNWEGAVKGQNASYDLTAVQFAALGICDLYDLDTPGDLEFYAEVPDLPDATRFVENPMGNKIFMTKKVPDEVIAESLQKILSSF